MEAVDIHKACRIGDVQGLIRVLSRSPDSVNSLDPKLGWPPLYRAVICNQFAIAKILLERGADPNQSNRLGEAPLHQAADGGLEEFSRLLLAWQADPNVQQRGSGHVDGETPLHRAAEKGRAHVAELLLKSKASVNTRSKSVILTQLGKTPLHLAVEFNQIETATVLLMNGANRDIPDCQGRSPLDMNPSPDMIHCFEKARRSPILDSEDEDLLIMAESPTLRAAEVLSLRTSGSIRSVEVEKVERVEPTRALFVDPETCSSTGMGDLNRTISFGAEVRRTQLASWLEPFKLESLVNTLSDAGLDNVEALLNQVTSKIPLTESQLQSIGVKKPGHCVRLLAAIEAASQSQPTPDRPIKLQAGMFECCQKPISTPGFAMFPTMEEWLRQMDLGYLYPSFLSTGYDHLESVLALSRTKYALTDSLLERRLGVQSPVDRSRLLNRIREDAPRTDLFTIKEENDELLDQAEKTVACRMSCEVM